MTGICGPDGTCVNRSDDLLGDLFIGGVRVWGSSRGITTRGSIHIGTEIKDQEFDNVDYSGSFFYRCKFKNCSFLGGSLEGARVERSSVDGCSFRGISLDNLKAMRAKLHSVDVSACSARGMEIKKWDHESSLERISGVIKNVISQNKGIPLSKNSWISRLENYLSDLEENWKNNPPPISYSTWTFGTVLGCDFTGADFSGLEIKNSRRLSFHPESFLDNVLEGVIPSRSKLHSWRSVVSSSRGVPL